MPKVNTYLSFRDAVLVALADEVEPPGWGAIRLVSLCERHGIEYQETWIMALPQDLADSGLADNWSSDSGESVRITGKGIAKATEIRQARAQPFRNTINSMNWQMWAVVVAVAACIATIIFT